jgi:hypothetical protein
VPLGSLTRLDGVNDDRPSNPGVLSFDFPPGFVVLLRLLALPKSLESPFGPFVLPNFRKVIRISGIKE